MLTKKKIKWIIRWKENGKSTKEIAMAQKISRRRVQQLYKEYKQTGEMPVLKKNRRPKKPLTDEQKEIIREAYNESFFGARMLRYHIRKKYRINIPHNKMHEYLLKIGCAKENKRKQKKRKRCRYERKHSFSLLHSDWLDWGDIQAIAYEDDASRKILSIGEFSNANTHNSIEVLKEAISEAKKYCGFIEELNTDRGTQFFPNKKNKKGKAKSRYLSFLESAGIKHIPSKRSNPQTNGKMERWVQEYKKHRHRFQSGEEFMNWCNNRIHGALDLENGETPNEAFMRKMKPECLLGMFYKNVG